MRQAIDICRLGIRAGNSPFGCVIVLPDGQSFADHNHVWQNTDSTAHAEICCLRKTCAAAGRIDLSGAWLFTTTEPCPMCAAACHWARIERVIFGAAIADAAAAGFSELQIACADLLRGSPLKVVGGVLADECRALFQEWQSQGKGRAY